MKAVRLVAKAGGGSEHLSMAPRAVLVMVREMSKVVLRRGHEVGEGSIVEVEDEGPLTASESDAMMHMEYL